MNEKWIKIDSETIKFEPTGALSRLEYNDFLNEIVEELKSDPRKKVEADLSRLTFGVNENLAAESLKTLLNTCSHIVKICVPNKVKVIEEAIFKDCTNLEEVYLPSSIRFIGANAFENCYSLRVVSEIPEGVTEICCSTFRECRSLTKVRLPESIVTLSSYGFSNCTSLDLINFPTSLKIIGDHCFENCALHLTSMNLDGVQYHDQQNSEITKIGAEVFFSCNFQGPLIIPGSVRTIEAYAFCRNKSLESVIIKNGTVKIEEGAFSYCDNLKDITLPESIHKIHDTAFKMSCIYSLADINYDTKKNENENEKSRYLQVVRTAVKTNTTDNEAQSFESSMCGLITLNKVKEKNGTAGEIKEGKKKEIKMKTRKSLILFTFKEEKESKKELILDFGVDEIATALFSTRDVVTVQIADQISVIPLSTFSGCERLQKVILPLSIKTIENYAFNNCRSLTEIQFPESLEKIGSGAFLNCVNLKTVSMNSPRLSTNYDLKSKSLNQKQLKKDKKVNGILIISFEAFMNCSSLESLCLMPLESCQGNLTVISIQEKAFRGCVSLKVIKVFGAIKADYGAFEDSKVKEVFFSNRCKENIKLAIKLLTNSERHSLVQIKDTAIMAKLSATEQTQNQSKKYIGVFMHNSKAFIFGDTDFAYTSIDIENKAALEERRNTNSKLAEQSHLGLRRTSLATNF